MNFLQWAEGVDYSDQLAPFLSLKLKKPLKSGHVPIVPAENPSSSVQLQGHPVPPADVVQLCPGAHDRPNMQAE